MLILNNTPDLALDATVLIDRYTIESFIESHKKYMADLEYQTPNVVTFSIKMEGDFGAESWNSYELYTFDVKTGYTVSLESSSAKAEEMTQDIMSLTKKAIKEKGINISLKEGESEDSVITTNMNRQGHFGILADGVHVNYQKYDLTTENDQILEVVLEANKANSLLMHS